MQINTGENFCKDTCVIFRRSRSYCHLLCLCVRFLSPANQRVTDSLIDNVYNDTGGAYTAKDIKRATHRYYESRRRLGIEDMPERQV